MSNQEQKLASVKKSCKTARTVSRIMTTILSVAGALSALGGALIFSFGDKVNEIAAAHPENVTVSNAEIHGLLSLTINLESMVERGHYSQAMMTACLFGAIICFIAAFVCFLIYRALLTVERSDSPFDRSVLAILQNAFIVLTVVVAVFTGLGVGVLVGLCLWCVYCIMDYGCTLQEEVDETV